MKGDKKVGVRAPLRRTSSFGRTPGGDCSFEAYFLRDLYSQKKIDEKLILEIVKKEKLDVSAQEVIKVMKDTGGRTIPLGLSKQISEIAYIIAADN